MTVSQVPATCQRCSAPLFVGHPCRNCGAPAGASFPPRVVVAMAPKTPGLAVLLSFLWFGAGHLYANRTASGIVLMVVDLLILCVALTGVGLVVALPLWVVMAPIVMAMSAAATTDYNRRNGLVIR